MKSNIALFQVRYLPFQYEDRPDTHKNRPVILCNISKSKALVLVAKVTSHAPRNEFPREVLLKDWEYAGLSKPSVARCSKVAVVPIEDIKNTPLLGVLSERDALAVALGLLESNQIQ